ncbi:hypothetical protein [Paenimyroides baculatum]|uniref:Uncharacterized protein n=1 Tax=Paenimyroides baculatum TaxID=2608000 RepID=A0A5M6CME0_9FLAO|nr:hypothetical protein [Paenimyroides baculatum]KAA5534309.1 hypothetical protein F0460_09380 [Paenimyroides baculatum]
MTFKNIYNKYNSKNDIAYKDYVRFSKGLNENITVDELYTLLAEFYHVDKSIFDDIMPEQLEQLTGKIKDIAQTSSPLVNRFKLNGVEYGLIPNFSKITAGELIDLDTLLSQENITGVVSILYRPIIKSQWNPFGILGQKRYKIEKYKEPNYKDFESVPLNIVDGVMDFFLSSYLQLNQDL